MVKDLNQLAAVRIFADQTAVVLREGSLIARVRRLLLWECVMETLPLLWLLWCWCCCCCWCVPMAAYLPPPTLAPTPAPLQQRLNSLSLPETGEQSQSTAQDRIIPPNFSLPGNNFTRTKIGLGLSWAIFRLKISNFLVIHSSSTLRTHTQPKRGD